MFATESGRLRIWVLSETEYNAVPVICNVVTYFASLSLSNVLFLTTGQSECGFSGHCFVVSNLAVLLGFCYE